MTSARDSVYMFEDSEGSDRGDISEDVTLDLDLDAGASEDQSKPADWNELVSEDALLDA